VAFWPQRQSLGRPSGILSYCWEQSYSRISYGRNLRGLQAASVLCSVRLSAISDVVAHLSGYASRLCGVST
jgi:hypothetical protein